MAGNNGIGAAVPNDRLYQTVTLQAALDGLIFFIFGLEIDAGVIGGAVHVRDALYFKFHALVLPFDFFHDGRGENFVGVVLFEVYVHGILVLCRDGKDH